MEDFYFEFPTKKREKEAMEFIEEFRKYNSAINGTGNLDEAKSYDEWLELTEKIHNNIDVDPNWVQSSTYFFIRKTDDKVIGMVNIRHRLNEFLESTGAGHIGCSIRPTERKKGFGTLALELALNKCVDLGIEEVIVGCYTDNIGSQRCIENNGGIKVQTLEFHGKPSFKYYIDNKTRVKK